MAKKKKYYVVWHGQEPGVYDNWQDCQAQISGFPGAIYKSFTSKEEAEYAFTQNPRDFLSKKSQKKKPPKSSGSPEVPRDLKKALSVDAACSGNPGIMEYRGVWVGSGKEEFRQGPFRYGTNNVGEFLALVHGLALLESRGRPDIPLFTDSKIAIGWVKNGKAKTKLRKTPANTRLFELVARAEAWLKKHEIRNAIYKWNTREWGEIPADFGRK